MFLKPFSLILTFVLTIVNFILLLLPFVVLISPLFLFAQELVKELWLNILLFIAFCTSFLMLVYMAFDMLFGFTVRNMSVNAKPFAKFSGVVAGHEEIGVAFDQTKKRFGQKNVELYLDQRVDVINAFAVGSLLRKRMIISIGLLNVIRSKCHSESQYIDAIKGVMGHEMSHLIHHDYLPGLLISANRSANKLLSSILRTIFLIVTFLLRIIPVIGPVLNTILIGVYNLFDHIIHFFFNYVIMPIYRFLQKTVGRSVEYRCDRQAAYAFGGHCMALALSALGKGSYFSVFSTHPKTKTRIAKVKDIRRKTDSINSSIIVTLTNVGSILLLVWVCYFCATMANVPNLSDRYTKEVHRPLIEDIENIKTNVINMIEQIKKGKIGQ